MFSNIENLAILLHKVHVDQDIYFGEFKYL